MKRSNCLASQALLTAARQRPEHDAEHCRLVLEHLDTTAVLHTAIHRTLGHYHLSELQFGVLISLFALDPEPVTSADLAIYTAVSRSAITEALDHSEEQQLVVRVRDERDRRIIRVQLTGQGQAMAEPVSEAILHTLTGATRYINNPTHLLGGYALLQAGAGSSAY